MGRHPKPEGLRRAQGNPGHREIQETPATPAPSHAPASLPFAKLSDNARLAYRIIGDDLRHLNFVRTSDEPLLLRYCDAIARFWRVTAELDDLGGETYECTTTGGGTMLRMRPQFMVQERLAKRLESMEDRLGLSPMARQQYLLRMSQGARLPFGDNPPNPQKQPKSAPSDTSAPPPEQTQTVSAFGFLKTQGHA